MPQELFRDSGFLLAWYSWGVLVGFAAALASTFWIFYEAQRGAQEATGWKSLAAVGTVLVIPFLLARLSWSFALSVYTSLDLLAYLSFAGAVAAVVAGFGYTVTARGQAVAPTNQPWPYPSPAAQPPPVPLIPEVSAPPGATVAGSPIPEGAPSGPREGQTRVMPRTEEGLALAALMITNGRRAGTPFTLKRGETRIGRSSARNDHFIEDDAASEEHLVIRYEGGKFILNDLGSTNHTYVNGEDVARHTLADWDLIRIGETEFVFRSVEVEPAIRGSGAS